MIDFEKLTKALSELDEDTMMEILNEVMADGGSQVTEAITACQKGLDIVGELFETKEYFVSDLIYAGELMTAASDLMRPALAASGTTVGEMILCTVKNDLHDIGKNIVRSMLEASGMKVLDLGVDTSAETIIQAAKENDIHIIGLSGVLTLAVDSMQDIILAVRESGLEAKIIIGGCPVSAEVCERIGADAWAKNPQETVRCCLEWVKN